MRFGDTDQGRNTAEAPPSLLADAAPVAPARRPRAAAGDLSPATPRASK